MAKNLLVVESPAKAKTINKYLGKDFEVLASYGHVRDLVPKEGAVDPDHDFAMRYDVIERNERHVNAIAKALKAADAIYLATDPDREGEAISWHVAELMREKGLLDGKPMYRVVFSEITPRAIKAAVANPRQISDDMVNAQQARRALDYLVGFNLSPVLWRKVQRGLSAGLVMSIVVGIGQAGRPPMHRRPTCASSRSRRCVATNASRPRHTTNGARPAAHGPCRHPN